jgi:Inorganic Pyrophosphatase/Mannosyl-glycoprotein endo-beta-N-acetylglucosaminidase/ADP-Ribosyltransferase in polyvalent proteins
MANPDFSMLLASAPDAEPTPGAAAPAKAAEPQKTDDFSLLLSSAPDGEAKPSATGGPEGFVRTYSPLAQRVGKQLGVAPEVLLGQWGLETGWGKSVIPGTNNLGNIKDFSKKGPQAVDNATGSNDSYRQYESADQFGDDYASLIARRYKSAVGSGGDSQRFFTALKASGYAEDPQYIQKGVRAAGMVSSLLGAGGQESSRDVYSNYTPTPVQPRTTMEAVQDTALGAASGVVQGVGLLASAAGADNPVAQGASELSRSLMDMQSDQRKAERQARSRTIREAEQSGSAWEEVKANVGAFLEAPAETMLNALGTSAPTILMSFIPGLGQANAARLILQGAAGAAQGAGAVKSSIYEDVKNKVAADLVKSGMDKAQALEEAEKVAVGAQAYDGQNGGNIAAGALLGIVAGRTGIEGGLSKAGLAKTIPGKAAVGAIAESLPEAAQGAQERVAVNQALQNEGFDVPTFQGVAGQAAAEGIASAGPGALFGAIRPELQPVADKAAEPNSPLSKAAIAGAQSQPAAPEAPKVDPVTRLAELEAIGRGTEDQVITGPEGNQITIPGEPGRFFTDEEKAEYDQLKALRDATPGMTPDDEQAAKDAEKEKEPDLILERARGIEQMLRTNEGLSALRSENSPVSVQTFLSDLAKAKSPSTPASAREQSLSRLETTAEWLGFDLAALPTAETVKNAPADVAPTEATNERPMSPEAKAWMDSRPAGQPTVPTQSTVKAQEVSQMLRESQLSDEDRTAAAEALTTYRNPNLPERTRQQALNMALEIVGRTRTPEGTPSGEQTPAVLADIPPQPDTPEYFVREAERRENGAWEFRQLGFDDEADALVAEADSLREKAASARAGELGMEDSAEADADIASPPQQQTIDAATAGLPRVQIPAETSADTGEAGTALRRKRKGQLRQLADMGFDDVIRTDGGFVLINTRNKQTVTLDTPADAAMARAAIAESWKTKSNAAATSPENDLREPSKANIDAGNWKRGESHPVYGAMFRSENPAGSVRRGVDEDGRPWETQMVHNYGEFTESEGADGDPVDGFVLGPGPVWVIDQVKKDGSFDEHKLVVGPKTEEAARAAYLANYEKGWTGLGAITQIPQGELRNWLKNHGKKPAAESVYAPIEVKVNGQMTSVTPVQEDALPASVADSKARGETVGPAVTKRQAAILKGIAGVFGKEVVFYSDPENKTASDGFVRDGDSGRIYINVRSGMSPLAVLGHELMHILKAENPQAYEAIAKVVRGRVKDAKGFRAYYNQTKLDETADGPLSEGELEELISDLNGNLMSDPSFWGEVFAEIQASNPSQAKSIIAKLADFVQKIIELAARAFAGQGKFRSDQFINDAAAVREAFRKGLAQYAQGRGITKQAMQAEILRAGKGTDIKTSLSRAADAGSKRDEQVAKLREADVGRKIMAATKNPNVRLPVGAWIGSLGNDSPAELAQLLDVGAIDSSDALSGQELAAKASAATGEIRRSTSRAKDEYAEVEAKYKDTDQWMKAPNGEPTKLTERQWVQVRTPSFKKWFGDWEAAHKAGGVWSAQPGTVSVAVGDDGEPLVLYHGSTRGGFMKFDEPTGSKRGDLGIFMTDDYGMASTYVRKNRVNRVVDPEVGEQTGWRYISNKDGKPMFNMGLGDSAETRAAREKTYDAKAVPLYGEVARAGDQPGVYALFANIRNPNESHFEGANWDGSRTGQYQVRNEDGEPIYDDKGRAYFQDRDDALALAMQNEGAVVEPADEHYETTDTVVRDAWRYNNDGAIMRQVTDDGGGGGNYFGDPADVFVAMNAKQVKSADFNGGEFDSKQADIRRSQRRNDFEDPRDRIEVSTTVPRAKAKGALVNDAVNEKWVIDAEDVKASKDHQRAAIAAFKMYNAAKVTDSKQALQEVHDVVVDNLVWLFNKMPANIRERAKLWYDGANRIARELAAQYQLDSRQAAGVLAVLSPQKDWFMNVSLGERLIKIHEEHGNEPWSQAMTNWVRSYVAAAKDVGTKGKRQSLLDDAMRLEGKTLAEMNDRDAARFIRVFDETYHPRSYRVVTPEGGFGDYVTKGEDEVDPSDEDADLSKPGMVAWGSYPTIEKGVSILRNGDRDNLFRNLSEALGDEHKVRNFYNNIIAPGSADGHVTIDTHAVAAAFIKALSGNALEVMHNFGTTPKGAPGAGGNAATGASGLYGIFADAYRDAASKAGVLAREMQSITWEAIRSIFQPTFKSTRAGDVEKIFNRYKAGEITREEARDEAYKIAGGIKAMPWEGTPEGRYVAEGGTSFDGDIPKDPANRRARVLDPEDTKDKVTINLSAATSTIPGLAELGRAANKGDVLAQQLIQDIALDNLQHLLSGTSAAVKVDRITGLYFNEVEPSLGLTVTFSENDESAVLAAVAKFADNFNQEAVHVRRDLPPKVKHLTQFPDGSFATPTYRWKLKKALARKRIQSIIDQSGLSGLSFTDGYVEAYFVGDPKDEAKTIHDQLDEFYQQIAVAGRLLSGAGGQISRGNARLWAYGDGYGTRIGYAAIRGDIPGRNAVSSKTAQRVAGYLNATKDKDGNPVLGRVKTFDQASSITPDQEALQREMAEAFDALPENDLKNPRVRKAYAELAREVLRQFRSLPVKVEVLAGQGEPYKSSDAMRRDVLDNNHLYIFGTEPGAFGPPGQDFSSHPLLADSGIKDQNGYPLLFNDLLRAVHDYYAHSMTPVQFGPRGEEAAWKNHMSMTSSPWARWALTMETRAQNSWVNFRPDLDRDTPIKDRPFATQKAALIPVKYVLTGDRTVDLVMKEFIDSLPPEQRMGSKPVVKRSTQRDLDDNLVISFGDEATTNQSDALSDEIEAEQAKGHRVTYDVEVEDTGETAKMTVDGGEALADYDQRIETMTKLLECLRK